ncbi:FtsX-like permease family protein [Ideonella azotifigens]|uniref:ABC transporter permease n=1 Tax=Ideonella azotifigens TaxID=513160 RepID=A0ABP3UZU9_9BURK|nr:FtsX-like permease family protein [Ideonella azotifigens]MCD2340246.1 FtsX-like permease family protein [Ideonella azotifigens]
MFLLKLLLRNAFRHKLRTALTIVGLVVAVSAFGLLRTLIGAWYAGVEASSSTRLVSRSAISLTFSLPISYAQRMKAIDGVTTISWANWFGGIYQSERNFFPQFAVHAETYLKLYPEYVLKEEEKIAFLKDRQGAIVGRKLAETYGWKIGDQIPLRGTIYPGTWTFTLRGIWDGAEKKTDEGQMLFHYETINEFIRKRAPLRADNTGAFILGIDQPQNAALIARAVDAEFKNSLAETLTETEAAFQLSFVSMSETILAAIQAVSYIIVVIIMAVMANTMTMTARERLAEYATLKALGFSPGFVVKLLFGESLVICLIGGLLGVLVTFPAVHAIAKVLGSFLPAFEITALTMGQQMLAALIVGVVAAAWPAWRMSRIDIVQGLRHVG